MNDAAKTWVATLRSGKFRQVQGGLRKNPYGVEGFCCLGVACEISGAGKWNETAFRDEEQDAAHRKHVEDNPRCQRCYIDRNGNEKCVGYELFISEEFTSPVVQKWLGLLTRDGKLVLDGKKTSLAELNDEGRSFDEIADIIEENQYQLFE